jgi:hypothetical protein
MPWVGFKPTIPVFKWAKTFHSLDSAATVIGSRMINEWQIWKDLEKSSLYLIEYFPGICQERLRETMENLSHDY